MILIEWIERAGILLAKRCMPAVHWLGDLVERLRFGRRR